MEGYKEQRNSENRKSKYKDKGKARVGKLSAVPLSYRTTSVNTVENFIWCVLVEVDTHFSFLVV